MPWHYPESTEGIIGHLRRATVLKTDDSGTQQILKKLRGIASERPEDVYRPQSHGLSSHAPSGSEGLFLSLGGRSDRLLALGFEHKDKRPKSLPEGAAVLYDANGNIVRVMMKDGIHISAEKGKVYVKPGGGEKVYLGGTGADGNYGRVATEIGLSKNVYALVG